MRGKGIIITSFCAILLIACESNNTKILKDAKTSPCSLQDKIDTGSWLYDHNFKDFTVKNILKTVLDKEGTNWTSKTNDEFRIVFKNRQEGMFASSDGDLLIYKDNILY